MNSLNWRAGRLLCGALVFMLAVGLTACSNRDRAQSQNDPLVVSTSQGKIKGSIHNLKSSSASAEVYLGIPFAAPPTGDLRFAPPSPPGNWKGVRDGSVAPSMCPQPAGGEEDCLYLNIFRPLGTSAKDKLPVMVYAYGGANVAGSANEFDGTRMAALNRIIVVVPNYRIGALGFLNDPKLALETGQGGNYGVSDLRAALQWVEKHISSFGGNPRNVTLAAQSSGATNACRLLVDPRSKGLFDAAILSSDDCIHDVDTLDQSYKRSRALIKKLNCGGASNLVACLRAKPARDFVGGAWNPVSDTFAISAISKGKWNKVPVMLGSTENEGRSAGNTLRFRSFTAEQYQDWLSRMVGKKALPLALERYPFDKYRKTPYPASYIIGDVITDSGMRGLGGCTDYRLAMAFAKQTPTWFYQFEDQRAPGPVLSQSVPSDYDFEASHGYDRWYLFPDSSPEAVAQSARFTPEQWQLSEDMIHYWGAFARNHNPNSDLKSFWPRLKNAAGQKMSLRSNGKSAATSMESFYKEHQCGFWLRTMRHLVMARGEK